MERLPIIAMSWALSAASNLLSKKLRLRDRLSRCLQQAALEALKR